jgi:hypothetical protein
VSGRRTPRALIASLCLAAQAFALAHLFLVVHTRCDEHGEVVHGDDHHERDTDDTTTRWATGGDETGAPDHDHCQTFAEPRELRTDTVHAAFAPVATSLAQATEHAPPVTARPLYRIAPKSSPPAAR